MNAEQGAQKHHTGGAMASIAINGLGRIGRAALKILEGLSGAKVVAVNDLVPSDNLAYLL
jgi:glyceraldehyde 3-phosphate dehydrogenase